MTDTPPFSPEAEESVIGSMLASPSLIPEVVAAGCASDHFYRAANRTLFDSVVESHYADDPIDPLTVGERCSARLMRLWGVDRDATMSRVRGMASGRSGEVSGLVGLLRRRHEQRGLLKIAESIQTNVENDEDPVQVAGGTAADATAIATDTLSAEELISFADSGRTFIQDVRQDMAVRAQGLELGVYFGLPFIDDWVRGLKGSELLFSGGPPGAGKSMVWWRAAQLFAERQMQKPEEHRIGVLVLSLEMGHRQSNARLATALTGIPGDRIREATLDQGELQRIVKEWGKRKSIPLWMNYAANMRLSQLRALVTEAVRQHNVGLVVIDHFRQVDPDKWIRDENERDEVKVRFLKEEIAKALDVAVVCLAHTTKLPEGQRPRLVHLRGSGQIAAVCDVVNFIYRPFKEASQEDKESGAVSFTDAEMIYDKNRNGDEGTAEFFLDPSRVSVRAQ